MKPDSCPHCGSAEHPMVEEYQFPPDDEGEAWKWGYHVVCSAAGFDHMPRGCGSSSGWGETPDEAIAAWNRRTMRRELENEQERVIFIDAARETAEAKVARLTKERDEFQASNDIKGKAFADASAKLRAATTRVGELEKGLEAVCGGGAERQGDDAGAVRACDAKRHAQRSVVHFVVAASVCSRQRPSACKEGGVRWRT